MLDEVHDLEAKVVSILCYILLSSAMTAQGYCHFNDDGDNRSFSINLFDMDLEIEQDPGSRDLGHGAVVWDASVVLSKYMEKNYKEYDVQTLGGKSVLELGSGCGLGGMAFMLKGSRVTYTDLENVTRRLTEKNVQVCGLRQNQLAQYEHNA